MSETCSKLAERVSTVSLDTGAAVVVQVVVTVGRASACDTSPVVVEVPRERTEFSWLIPTVRKEEVSKTWISMRDWE